MSILEELLTGIEDLKGCRNLKPQTQTPADMALMKTTRTETDGKMTVFEGKLPADMSGVFYVIYPVGSVNSGGLPFPQLINGKYNGEYATPIMNGDGMIVSINLDGSQTPAIKSRIIKSPCYFADYNTRVGTAQHDELLGMLNFSNFGISRMNMILGARDLLNTAVIPVKFKDTPPFLLSTYDVGRPFIMDPVKLKLQSPLGATTDWVKATPDFLKWVFPIVQTTAHPSFDPNTQELFSVNYCKSSSAQEYKITERTAYYLEKDPIKFEAEMEKFCETQKDEKDPAKIAEALMDFLNNLDHYMTGAPLAPATAAADTSVWLMRWKGDQTIEKWTLIDAEGGNAIQIDECMHQTSLTKDYIVLTQTAFKFALDLLINNPFPNHPCIDILIRYLLASSMLPFTDCYIVKRSDLKPGGGTVVANKVTLPTQEQVQDETGTSHAIPCETIHYSCEYQNPNQKITFYAMHNSSSCVAEWIRPYDSAQISGKQVKTNLMGMFALGSMDVNRVGKWVIDCSSFVIDTVNSKQFSSPGKVSVANLPAANQNTDFGPNTWTLGLYTYRDMISPVKTVDTIKYIWYIANGADPDYLTTFIYGLYKNAPDRILPVNDVLAYTKKGIPQSLIRMNCATMVPDDYYQFAYGTYIRSIQFIPRNSEKAGAVYETDGYLFCTMQVPVDAVNYRSEYWVFDAAKVATGPVAKLLFSDIQFCFTLHSAYMESAQPYSLNYDVDVKTDYNGELGRLFGTGPIADAFLNFFNTNVYADWYKQKQS